MCTPKNVRGPAWRLCAVAFAARLLGSAALLGSLESALRQLGSSAACRAAAWWLGGSRGSRRRRNGRLHGCFGGPAARIGGLRGWAWPSRRPLHQRCHHARGFRGGAGAAAAPARPQRPRWPLAGRSRTVRPQRPFAAALRGGRKRRPFAAIRGALRGPAASAASMAPPGLHQQRPGFQEGNCFFWGGGPKGGERGVKPKETPPPIARGPGGALDFF